VHNNHLSSLPDELALLRRLFALVLAFNHFDRLPPVLIRMTKTNVSEIENVIFAGNQVFVHIVSNVEKVLSQRICSYTSGALIH